MRQNAATVARKSESDIHHTPASLHGATSQFVIESGRFRTHIAADGHAKSLPALLLEVLGRPPPTLRLLVVEAGYRSG